MPPVAIPQVMLNYQGLCICCKRNPTAYDTCSQLFYQYCSMTCAALSGAILGGHVKSSKGHVCKHCSILPRLWDSQRGQWYDYCGQACAHAAAAAKSGREAVYVQQVAQEPRRKKIPYPIRFFHESAPFFNFTNDSRHSVAYKGLVYPTAQHVYQAMKFLPKYPELAERIRRRSSANEARREARRYRNYIRADWTSTHRGKLVHIAKVEEVLNLKFIQHPELCEELVSTSGAELLYDYRADAFWGVGPNDKGKNEFGKAMMRIRKNILEQNKLNKRQRRG